MGIIPISLGSSGLIDVVRLIIFRHWLSASRPAEDLSARLVVDGVPYRESIGSYALLSRHASSGILERDLVLNLQVRTAVQTPNAPTSPLVTAPMNWIVVSWLTIPCSFPKWPYPKLATIKAASHPTTSIEPYLSLSRHPQEIDRLVVVDDSALSPHELAAPLNL